MSASKKSSYVPFTLQLSDEQADRLARGDNIRLKAEDIEPGAGDVVFLTAQQVTRLRKAKAGGKGAELRLSDAQRRHQLKVGSGRFTDMLRGITKAVKGVVQKVAPVVKTAVKDTASRLLDEHGPSLVQGVKDAVGSVGSRATRATAQFLPDPAQEWLEEGFRVGQEWSGERIQSFLRGLNQTLTGGQVLGGGLYLQGARQG